MKNFSNKYMILYSAALVCVAALLLSVVAMSLKSRQDANIRNEKMQSLLQAIDVRVSADQAESSYKQYFKRELTVSTSGEVITDYDVATVDIRQADRAFNTKLKEQQYAEKNGQKGAFPVYVFEKEGRTGYVIPTQGNGLWGAVYANMALDSDLNTVIGVTFSHDSETPGLGDKITTPEFQAQFVGKKILDEQGQVVSVKVKKNANMQSSHEVDAITGGTMTSNGVDAMLLTDLGRYQKFIDTQLQQVAAAPAEAIEDEAVESEQVCNSEQGKEATL